MNTKQVIIIRKDLNIRKGKMITQGAHASVLSILEIVNNKRENLAFDNWINGSYTKICLYVNSEKELLNIIEQAKNQQILCCPVVDLGLTEFDMKPTLTCCAIGPEWSDKIDKITKDLPLL